MVAGVGGGKGGIVWREVGDLVVGGVSEKGEVGCWAYECKGGEAYFAELIRVDDETAAFFRDVLHCCDPGRQVVGVWSDVDSSLLSTRGQFRCGGR